MNKIRLREFTPIALILGFTLSLRLWRLNQPKGYIFDEIYYAKNAASLINDGVELNEQGEAEFVVHPPLGKWLIGLGIKAFGDNEFGWRISAALIGTASVLLIFMITQLLFNSLMLSNTAAALMSLDGLHLVMSRVALLDIFLMFFILLAFYLILRNNFWLSGVAIGFAGATKWSAFFLIPFLILLTLSFSKFHLSVLIRRIVQYTLAPIGVYFISWSGWLFNSKGWGREFGSNPFDSLWIYHRDITSFHRGLTEEHAYAANPWSWLILGRPTPFYYETPANCGASTCSQEILALGTPVLWWVGAFAIAITFGFFVFKPDQISAFILAGIAGTYLPWFFIQDRITFYFYSISILPFLILSVINLMNWALHKGMDRRYLYGYLVLVGINFTYFLPILIGLEIPYSDWIDRMWLPSWI